MLERLLARPGEPGLMRPLAAVLLGRLLGRQGNGEGVRYVEDAARIAADSDEVQLMGSVAAALVEIEWLGGRRAVPPLAKRTLRIAVEVGHSITYGEVMRYLQRMGSEALPHTAVEAPEPWAAALVGDLERSIAQWRLVGERYEAAVEVALHPDSSVAAEGRLELKRLGPTPPSTSRAPGSRYCSAPLCISVFDLVLGGVPNRRSDRWEKSWNAVMKPVCAP